MPNVPAAREKIDEALREIGKSRLHHLEGEKLDIKKIAALLAAAAALLGAFAGVHFGFIPVRNRNGLPFV